MEAAFDRLTNIQQKCINKSMFKEAFDCVAESNGDSEMLNVLIKQKTEDCLHLEADMIRYCKLVQRVM